MRTGELEIDAAYRRYAPMVFRRCVQLLRDEEGGAELREGEAFAAQPQALLVRVAGEVEEHLGGGDLAPRLRELGGQRPQRVADLGGGRIGQHPRVARPHAAHVLEHGGEGEGGERVPAFLSDASATVKGEAVLTSSAAQEPSQESDRLGGSYFTHHLISGLRGAADVSGDGKVTLDEAYRYAFNETLAGTERTVAGGQHPAYEMALSGSGEVVMTDLRSGAALLELGGDLAGRVYVRDAAGALVVELFKRAGARVELGLAPGTYHVSVARLSSWAAADIDARAGARAVVTEAQLRPVPAEENR